MVGRILPKESIFLFSSPDLLVKMADNALTLLICGLAVGLKCRVTEGLVLFGFQTSPKNSIRYLPTFLPNIVEVLPVTDSALEFT